MRLGIVTWMAVRLCGLIVDVLDICMSNRSPDFVRRLIIQKMNDWANLSDWRYAVAYDMQGVFYRRMGYPICAYCHWIIWLNQAHGYCQDQLEMEQLVAEQEAQDIEAYYREQEVAYQLEVGLTYEEYLIDDLSEQEDEDLNELCPCVHTRSEHQGFEDDCVQCNCPQFGMDPCEWDPPQGHNVGDGPGGFMIYE